MLFLDFYYFYAAGSLLAAGQNPYDLELHHAAMIELGWPPEKWSSAFPYPPTHLLIFVILAQLPFSLAIAIWSVISLYSVYIFFNVFTSNRQIDLKTALAVLSFFPIWKLVLFGQTTWILLLSVALAVRAIEQRKDLLGGIWIGFSLLKPHLVFVAIPILIFQGGARSAFLRIFGVTITLTLGAIFSLVMRPTIFAEFFSTLQGNANFLSAYWSDSIVSWLNALIGSWIAFPVMIFGILLAIASILWHQSSIKEKTSQSLIWSLFFAPYAWSHDLILILPVYLEEFRKLFLSRHFLLWISLFMALQISLMALAGDAGLAVILALIALLSLKKQRFNFFRQV